MWFGKNYIAEQEREVINSLRQDKDAAGQLYQNMPEVIQMSVNDANSLSHMKWNCK